MSTPNRTVMKSAALKKNADRRVSTAKPATSFAGSMGRKLEPVYQPPKPVGTKRMKK